MASTSRRPRTARRTTRRAASRRRHPAARRRPAARRTRRGWRRALPRRHRGLTAGVGVVMLLIVGDYLASHPAVLAAVLALAGAAVTGVAYWWGRGRWRQRRRDGHGAMPAGIETWRALSPGGFEHAVARLCRRDGCTRVEVLGGANDRAGDVRARTPDGRLLLVQCKRYGEKKKVASEVLYQVNGTYRETHGCDLAAVVTTSSFTASAVDWNSDIDQPLKLFGSRQLLAWAQETGPAPWQ
ncbi:restriction endonuclease [Streptomyces lasiicapitis]|uniref:restriction endonuclease n=1 Tax=Streptomyces lasiicapitis TaxID=1923961 RepID=UPI00332E7774